MDISINRKTDLEIIKSIHRPTNGEKIWQIVGPMEARFFDSLSHILLHSFISSFIHSFIHSFIYSFIHSSFILSFRCHIRWSPSFIFLLPPFFPSMSSVNSKSSFICHICRLLQDLELISIILRALLRGCPCESHLSFLGSGCSIKIILVICHTTRPETRLPKPRAGGTGQWKKS